MAKSFEFTPMAAVVAQAALAGRMEERYLLLTEAGEPVWVADPQIATPFASMREATRMAMRLPARDRAFSMPRDVEISAHRLH